MGVPVCSPLWIFQHPGGDLPLLLRLQAPSLSLRPRLASRGAPIHTIQIPPWHQHVAQRAPWMRKVSLLQDHHSVLDVLVPDMHPHSCPRCRQATTPLNWEGPWSLLFRKRHPKRSGTVAPVAVSLVILLPRLTSRYAVLGLVVDIQ